MDLDQLRSFLAVLEHGSFSTAARALHLSQSTVSFHIKSLEQSVGARLCDRGGRRVRPTPAGTVLRGYAERLLALRDEALSKLRDEERGERGRLVIAASTIAAEYLLPPILARFRRRYPQVAIEVKVSDSRRAMAALLAEDCQLALVGALERDRRVVSSPFAEDEVVLVGAAGSPRQLSAEELACQPLILREEGSGTRRAIARLLPAAPAPGSLQVASTEAAKNCALAGLGLAFVSSRAIAGEVAAGRLLIVSVPGLPVRRRFHVARLRSITPSVQAAALWAMLRQPAGETGSTRA